MNENSILQSSSNLLQDGMDADVAGEGRPRGWISKGETEEATGLLTTAMRNQPSTARFVFVSRKPTKIEIVQEAGERFLVKTFLDGTEEREAIVKKPRKKRYPDRPYWVWKFDREGK